MKHENKVIEISIVIVVIIIIIIGVLIFFLLKSEKTSEKNNVISNNNINQNVVVENNKNTIQENIQGETNNTYKDNTYDFNQNTNSQNNSINNSETKTSSNEVQILGPNDEVKGFSINENINKVKQYTELTQAKYTTYNAKNNQTFRIQDVSYNSNGTITIKGRVYRYLELPTLTAKQYEALENGNSLVILGEKVTKDNSINMSNNSQYDMKLNIETKEFSYKMTYYVKKNSDGTGKLYNGVDSRVAQGTNIYMQITLDKETQCMESDKAITLDEHYQGDYHIEDKNRTRLLHENDYFQFKDEKCTGIIFCNI